MLLNPAIIRIAINSCKIVISSGTFQMVFINYPDKNQPTICNQILIYEPLIWSKFITRELVRIDQTSYLRKTSRLDHEIRPPQQSIRSDLNPPNFQTKPSCDQTTKIRSDSHRHTRPLEQISPTDNYPGLLILKSAQCTQPRETVQELHSLWVGSRGVYRALDEPWYACPWMAFGWKPRRL